MHDTDPKIHGAAPRDAGEMRAIALAAAGIALFVYLIRFILLPFVVAGIIAYICTPLLDRLAARTRLPRPLLAVLLFLLLIGLAAFAVAIAGHRLVTEAGGAVSDLQGMLDRLSGGQPTFRIRPHHRRRSACPHCGGAHP